MIDFEPRRILVRAPNWLGDVVMSTPGFRTLRQRFPSARITALLPEALAPILDGHPDLDEVWGFDASVRSSIGTMSRRIARAGFDLGIAIPESISSALMMRLGRVPHVLGFARDPIRRALLHETVPADAGWGRRRLVSKERFVLRLMDAVGARSDDPSLDLRVTPEERARLAAVLDDAGGCDVGAEGVFAYGASRGATPIVIAPGSAFGDAKCWPASAFASLADELSRRGERVVLLGSAAERGRIDAVRSAMRLEAIDLAGRLDLGAVKALLEGAKLLIGNDSGARHVATALGTPSVIFFGPTAVEKTNANLASVSVLESQHDCRPCYSRTCPIDHRCLVSITVPEAIAAVDARLGRSALAVGSPRVAGSGLAR